MFTLSSSVLTMQLILWSLQESSAFVPKNTFVTEVSHCSRRNTDDVVTGVSKMVKESVDRSELKEIQSSERIPPSIYDVCVAEIPKLKSGSDIRGQYASDEDAASIIGTSSQRAALLTPTSAYCLGYSFANMVKQISEKGDKVSVCIGNDPRSHGDILSKYVCVGAQAAGVIVNYTGIATTPAMLEFSRAEKLDCDGGIMITASHLPADRNGMKLFTPTGGLTKTCIEDLIEGALAKLTNLKSIGGGTVKIPSILNFDERISRVDFMPYYAKTLNDAVSREVIADLDKQNLSDIPLPLAGLVIVLNAGNGSGYFFNKVLNDLGADVSGSIGIKPDPKFPYGVPNPEEREMVQRTISRCEEVNADIGIMLDTDADRGGFVIPRTVIPSEQICKDYEPLNRNRLIALLSVIFSSASPGCSIVTDSVTSEGLEMFLEETLGLKHVRFLKGYANVINKAKEITESGSAVAEMAIETSGHCAMRENGYLDDGTYTAVKVIGLLARIRRSREMQENTNLNVPLSLLDLISELKEMPVVDELRMRVQNNSLAATEEIFREICERLEAKCEESSETSWALDRKNLEGVRIRVRSNDEKEGTFFMLRKSLHDPVLSVQVEASSKEQCQKYILRPLLKIIEFCGFEESLLDTSALSKF